MIADALNTDLHLDIGNWVSLEKVDKFCYLGDMQIEAVIQLVFLQLVVIETKIAK